MSSPLGSTVPLSITVRDAAGTPTAATVALTIVQPDGTPTTPAISTGSTGVYYVDFVPTQAGRHVAAWAVTGAVTSSLTDVFEVDATTDAPLVGLADMKRHLNLTKTVDDAELYDMGRAISDAIESHLGYPARVRTVTEAVNGGKPKIFLRKAPCVCSTCAPYRTLTVTGVVENGIPLAATTDYLFDPDQGALLRGPYGIGISWLAWRALDVVVTYRAGYASTPPWLRLAFLRALGNAWQSSQQRPHPGFAQAGADADPNFQITPYLLPYPVQSLLEPHRLGGF